MKHHRLALIVVCLVAVSAVVGLGVTLASTGPITFGPSTDYPAGTLPWGSDAGHLNGDANLDVVVAARGSGGWPDGVPDTVSILLGNGAGGFSYGTTTTVGDAPMSVAVRDLDGDAGNDVAVANYGSNSVSILLGDGVGSFSYGTTVAAGAGPWGVATGHFKGDSNTDILVVNRDAGTVSVLLGDGAGGFSHGTTVTVGNGPSLFGVGRFNGDANADFAVTNIGSANVSILLGDGAGGFSHGTTVTVGAFPYSVAVDDLNSDGNADLAVGNIVSNNVPILLGDGAGGFSYGTTVTAGTFPQIAVGDLNGDMDADLAVSNAGDGNLTIYRGDGAGGFSQEATLVVPSNPTIATVADFDNDLRPDLAISRFLANAAAVFLNTTRFDSRLGLSAAPSTVGYNAYTGLRGNLVVAGKPLGGRTDVQVWRKSAFSPAFSQDGTATWSSAYDRYVASRRVTSNTRFYLRFVGDSKYSPARSAQVLVKARALLSRPSVVPTYRRRNRNLTSSGAMWPKHLGSTSLQFYRKVGRRWVYYKTVPATLTNMATYTRYSAVTKLPYTGYWFVRGYHSDLSHAPSYSAAKVFYVAP